MINKRTLLLDNNVIDWNMNKFYKEANETHDSKTNSSCNCNLLEFYKELITFILSYKNELKLTRIRQGIAIL